MDDLPIARIETSKHLSLVSIRLRRVLYARLLDQRCG
jgi:hypothetical protein